MLKRKPRQMSVVYNKIVSVQETFKIHVNRCVFLLCILDFAIGINNSRFIVSSYFSLWERVILNGSKSP